MINLLFFLTWSEQLSNTIDLKQLHPLQEVTQSGLIIYNTLYF